MKLKFLDLQNCYRLIPPIGGLPLFVRLDECLQGMNDQVGILRGAIDALVRQNQISTKLVGSARFKASPLEIAQGVNVEERTIHTQAVTRPFPGPAQLHIVVGYQNGMTHKKIVPLQYLLKGWGDATRGHQCYVHTISENVPEGGSVRDLVALNLRNSGNYYYVGITGRNWLLRLDEHISEMRKGNPRPFYRAWRERYGQGGMLFTSALREVNLTYQDAMDWEEAAVDKIAGDEYGLNMIPGGFKGLRHLHEYRIIENTDISLEERDVAIAEYCRQNPRKGIPNLILAALWKDDEFYLRVIAAREKTLSPDQVRSIRQLDRQGKSLSEIANETGALNEQQVRNVISGRTYKRVR